MSAQDPYLEMCNYCICFLANSVLTLIQLVLPYGYKNEKSGFKMRLTPALNAPVLLLADF